MRNRQGALEHRRLFFTRPAEGGGGSPGTNDNPSTYLIFHCFLPLLLAHAGDRWEIFSFSSSHGPPPLPSHSSSKTKKTTVLLKFSKRRLQTSLGFGGVLAPLNRTRNGPKGVKAHLRPKPKESSQTKTNTHTHDHRTHLGLKEKAQ